MKISVDWIKDFVELPTSLDDMELAQHITLGVCEVEGFERIGNILNQIIVADITDVVPHPNADNLKLATVNLGEGGSAVVVCGAPNCRIGIKAAYAPIGVNLPNGLTLKPKEIRGILSEGMLCAEDELGLSDNHEGLIELDKDIKAGQTMLQALGDRAVSDLLLDIDNKSLTHRPDCWGHYGLAREFAAVFNQPFKDKFDAEWIRTLQARIAEDGGSPPVSIHVDRDSANLGFLGLSVDGVKIGSSPLWMRRRLHVAGMRPINTVVDISNYAMLETGIPNHIFDRTTICGSKIIVRRAGRDMDFTTLDGQVRRLCAADTVVCDAERESAIAGVMGGLESSVTEGTTQVMIEVANWVDAEIRRTGTRLGLRTDASMRYEKSLDSQQLMKGLLRIYELFLALVPGARAVGGIQSDNMPSPVDLIIKTSPRRISKILGKNINEKTLTRVLESLGFRIDLIPEGQNLTHAISVPTWRCTKDIECEVDIAEEIGRIIGYNNIKPLSPIQGISPLRLSPSKALMRKAQDFLVLRGRALEIMTYPLIGRQLLERTSWPILNEHLVLANAISPEHDRMRPSLIPSLLAAASANRREHETFRFFECGRSYTHIGGEFFSQDRYQIGIVFHAEKTNPFIDLSDTVENLLEYLKIPHRLSIANPADPHALVPANWPGSHPHEFLDIQIMNQSCGAILSLHPQVARAMKIKGRSGFAVLDLTDVMAKPQTQKHAFRPLDRFPSAEFDVTVVMPQHSYAEDAVSVVKGQGMKEIRSVGIQDVFELGKEGRAITLHIVFRDDQKTLDPEFLQRAEAAVITALASAGYPLRGMGN